MGYLSQQFSAHINHKPNLRLTEMYRESFRVSLKYTLSKVHKILTIEQSLQSLNTFYTKIL